MPAYKEPVRPSRPALPFTFWALIAVIFIEQAVLRGGWGMSRCLDAIVVLALAGGGLAAILGIWGRAGTARFTAFLALSFCTGALVASMGVETGRAAVAALQEHPISSWEFAISGDARLANGKYRMRARASLDGRTSTDVWLYADEPLYPGQKARGVGRLKPLGDGAWADASRAQGVNASVSLVKVQSLEARGGFLGAMDSLRRQLVESIAPDEGAARAFIAACVTGDRSGLDALNMNGDLRRCGVSHLVAVSGTHLALVAAAFSSALGAAKTRVKARSVILVIAMGLFVMLCGAPASAVRAWIMALVHAASVFANRRSHGLSALCAAAVAMALLDPFVTGQLAYQLSVAAVLGIYLVNPYLRYALEVLFARSQAPRLRLPRAWRMRALAARRALLDLLSLSMTAQLVTLPITASTFSEFSLVAPFANLLASPLIALLTLAGLAVCALLPLPGVQAAVLACADPLGKILVFLLKAVAAFPFAAIPTPAHPLALSTTVLSLVGALVWFSPKLTRRRIMLPLMGCISVIALWFCCNRFFAPACMVVLDVGQGDAILLQEGPYAVLVDAGPESALDDALMRCNVLHLDAVILSHLHNDHYGGVADLAGRVGCDQLISARGTASHVPDELAGWMHDAHIGGPVEIGYLDTVSFGHFTLTVLAPMEEVDGLENEDSMFLLVRFDDGRRRLGALLTGDGESGELGAVLAEADLAGIDILKVGHHGSENSITAAQAELLRPVYALCSAGKDNEFGHPHADTVNALVDAGSAFICTKDAGDIVMVPTQDGAKLRE